jgi:hypothetical protein
MAKALTLRHAVATTIFLVAQYRSMVQVNWQFGCADDRARP